MTGKIVCSSCGKEYSWQPQLAGHTVRCTCGNTMPVAAAPPQEDSVYALAPSDGGLATQRTSAIAVDDQAFACPSCGQPIEFGGVLCTACGYNARTGIHEKILPPPPPRPGMPAHEPPPPPPPTILPNYAPPPSTKYVETETRRDVLARYIGIIAVLLALIGVVMAARSFTAKKVDPTLSPEDANIAQQLQSPPAMEARQWFEAGEDRSIGGWNRRQAEAKIDEMYKLGAAKVFSPGGRFVMSMIIELPADNEKRRRLFEWQRDLHGSIGETVQQDNGQKYLQITVPR